MFETCLNKGRFLQKRRESIFPPFFKDGLRLLHNCYRHVGLPGNVSNFLKGASSALFVQLLETISKKTKLNGGEQISYFAKTTFS